MHVIQVIGMLCIQCILYIVHSVLLYMPIDCYSTHFIRSFFSRFIVTLEFSSRVHSQLAHQHLEVLTTTMVSNPWLPFSISHFNCVTLFQCMNLERLIPIWIFFLKKFHSCFKTSKINYIYNSVLIPIGSILINSFAKLLRPCIYIV